MYLSTLDSLVGFLRWVLSESLRLQPWGFFLFCLTNSALQCPEILSPTIFVGLVLPTIFVGTPYGHTGPVSCVVVSLIPSCRNPTIWALYEP
jgi:hypothetical protein